SGDDYNQTENTEDQTNYYCVSDFRMVIVSVHERTPSTGTISRTNQAIGVKNTKGRYTRVKTFQEAGWKMLNMNLTPGGT
ncbi:hypothetical protein KKF32_05370, partial [Patescibacteria group bacterium]|nr:hypothetical protein [Patescibacteria group bacterium]